MKQKVLLTEGSVLCLMFSTARKEKEVKGQQGMSLSRLSQPVTSGSTVRSGFAVKPF